MIEWRLPKTRPKQSMTDRVDSIALFYHKITGHISDCRRGSFIIYVHMWKCIH